MEPNPLATAAEALTDRSATHRSFSNATLVDGDGAPGQGTLFGTIRLRRDEARQIRRGSAMRVLIRRNLVTGATAPVTRRLAQMAAPFPASWLHDEWMAILAAATGTVTLIDEELFECRLHATNQVGMADPGVAAHAACDRGPRRPVRAPRRAQRRPGEAP